jgi:hypothetical protein
MEVSQLRETPYRSRKPGPLNPGLPPPDIAEAAIRAARLRKVHCLLPVFH